MPKIPRHVLDTLSAQGDVPESVRAAYPDLFSKRFSPAARQLNLETARKEVELAEVREEMNLEENEVLPDAQLVFEVSDLLHSQQVEQLRTWFRMQLDGQLPSERDQVSAGLRLGNPSLDQDSQRLKGLVESTLARRA